MCHVVSAAMAEGARVNSIKRVNEGNPLNSKSLNTLLILTPKLQVTSGPCISSNTSNNNYYLWHHHGVVNVSIYCKIFKAETKYFRVV